MPSFYQIWLVKANQSFGLLETIAGHPAPILEANRIQPEFRHLVIVFYMHMEGFVAIRRVYEEPE